MGHARRARSPEKREESRQNAGWGAQNARATGLRPNWLLHVFSSGHSIFQNADAPCIIKFDEKTFSALTADLLVL